MSPLPDLTKVYQYENRALLDLAYKLPCQNCRANDGTIVPAHSNQYVHGKGKSIKAHDCYFAALCHRCHVWLDQPGPTAKDPTEVYDPTRDGRREMFDRAMVRTWLELWSRELIKVA